MDNFWSLQPYNAQSYATQSSNGSLGNISYDSLSDPYNTYLQRTPAQEVVTSTFPSLSEPSDSAPVKSGKYLDDLYLNTWIKSTGYKPHRQGFYLNGQNSYFEINGQLIIGGPEIGTGVAFSGNDIFLLENTVGGTDPVTGDTTSIYFVRSDDTDPYNSVLSSEARGVLQKRKGIDSADSNVIELFFDQAASKSGKNYIFIGRPGGVAQDSVDLNDFTTDFVGITSGALIQIQLYSSLTEIKPPAIEIYNDRHIELDVNNNPINTINAGGSRMIFTTNRPTSIDYFTPQKLVANTWHGGGTIFQSNWGSNTGDILMVIDDQNAWFDVLEGVLPTGSHSITLGTASYTWLSTFSDRIYLTPTATVSAPTGAEGGLYADSTTHTLKYYNGTSWSSLGTGAGNMIQTIGTSLPSAATYSGQYYYLTTTDTLYRSNGTAWIALN